MPIVLCELRNGETWVGPLWKETSSVIGEASSVCNDGFLLKITNESVTSARRTMDKNLRFEEGAYRIYAKKNALQNTP
jgi:hypothetical protein